MRNFLSIDPSACIFAALLILILPLNWLAAAFFSAVFHELCHIGILLLLGGQIQHISIGSRGAVIHTEIQDGWKELLSTLAGPLGSIFLLSVRHLFPRLALCGLVQGTFNLLPLMPLDGGRILQCILHMLHISQKEAILNAVEFVTYLILILLAVAATVWFSWGYLPILAAGILIIKAISRKSPCKQRQIRVQ